MVLRILPRHTLGSAVPSSYAPIDGRSGAWSRSGTSRWPDDRCGSPLVQPRFGDCVGQRGDVVFRAVTHHHDADVLIWIEAHEVVVAASTPVVLDECGSSIAVGWLPEPAEPVIEWSATHRDGAHLSHR